MNPAARQIAIITVAAAGLFWGFRLLPTGTNLNHMDFRASGKNVIEFCDPANPQFIPVVNVRSPVTLSVRTTAPAVAGQEVFATAVLKTASGKPIETADLLVMHTKRLHLLVVDPTLTDYQHVHPEPLRAPGEWSFRFTPRMGGEYRVFADFTPAATGRGLYASADLAVAGDEGRGTRDAGGIEPRMPRMGTDADFSVVERDGFEFRLEAGKLPVEAGEVASLRFSIVANGGGVPLEPVMGAYAHLVAFDAERSGFAHLHPMDLDPTKAPDGVRPVLNFQITIPKAGRYVIWAQVRIGGVERFVPFWFLVL